MRHLFDLTPGAADPFGDIGRGRATGPMGFPRGAGGGERGDSVVICDGCLVLHRDGAIAYCSEELDGKPCAGYDMPHLAGVMACRVTPRGSRCRHCDDVMRLRLIMAPDFVPGDASIVIN